MATILNPTFIATDKQSILIGHGGGAVASPGDEITCAFISGTAIIVSITPVLTNYEVEITPTNTADWSLSPTHPYSITGGSMIGSVISHTPPTFANWTIGPGNDWTNYISSDGALGIFPGPHTFGDNMIKQSGVFTDWADGTIYTIEIEVANDPDHEGSAILYFGDQSVSSSYGAVYWNNTSPPPSTIFTYSHTATNDVFALEISNGSLAILSVTVTSESAGLSLIANPQELTPAYNPSVWYFDSTNKDQPGFRYFVEVLDLSDVVIATERYVPAIVTGYAVVDLTRVLKNFVSSDYKTNGIEKVPNSWFGYKIRVYEEYLVSYEYFDYEFGTDGTTNLHSLTSIHFFNVGDQVVVDQDDDGALKPGLQGLQTVSYPTVAGTQDLYLTLPFAAIGSGTTMGGTVAYADNRKTINPVYLETEPHYVFNGAVPFVNFPTYNQNDWILTSDTSKFLTSIPRDGFRIYESQQINLNFANYFSDVLTVRFENSNGDILENTTGDSNTTEAVMTAQVDPSVTITNTISGSSPLVKPDTEWYDAWMVDGSGNQISEKIRFYIDRRCRINEREIKFMDRMGSFASFSFELKGDITNHNKKSTYRRLVGGLGEDVAGPAYTYDLNEHGEKTFNVDYNQTLQLNTNWMDDASSVYFQELVTSPVTYLKIDNVYVAVIVSNPDMQELRQKNKRLIKYTIDVRFSNSIQNINI